MLFLTLATLIVSYASIYADQPLSIETCNNLISQRMLTASKKPKQATFAPTTSTCTTDIPSRELTTADGQTCITYGEHTITIQQGQHTRSLCIPRSHKITRIWTTDCQTLGLVLKDQREKLSTYMHRFCYMLDLEELTIEQQVLCKRAATAWQAHRAYTLEATEDELIYETLPRAFQHKALFKKDNALVSQPQPDTRALLYASTALKTVLSYLIGL